MGRGGRGNQTGGASRNKVSQVAETSTREEAKEKRDDVNVLDDAERHSIAATQTNSDALEKSHAELEAEKAAELNRQEIEDKLREIHARRQEEKALAEEVDEDTAYEDQLLDEYNLSD